MYAMKNANNNPTPSPNSTPRPSEWTLRANIPINTPARNQTVSDLVHPIPPGRVCVPALAILLTANRNSFSAGTRKSAVRAPQGTSAPVRSPGDTVQPSAQSSATHFPDKPAPADHPDAA